MVSRTDKCFFTPFCNVGTGHRNLIFVEGGIIGSLGGGECVGRYVFADNIVSLKIASLCSQ